MASTHCFSPMWVVALMTYTNVFNYVDRMVISGAPNEFSTFVADSLHVSVTQESVYIGFLMTSFIAAYSVANIVFGHMVRFYRPFRIVAVGLSIWCVAIFLSGLAKSQNSFYLLLGARALSGVGEAALQTVVPAFIDSHVQPSHKSKMLAIFYLGFPVGGALGFLWGSIMASSVGWNWAFWLELPAVIPVILICIFLPYRATHTQSVDQVSPSAPVKQVKGLHYEMYDILSSTEYKLVTVGSAAMLAIITSFATFGPTFMMGLGFFDNESSASFSFGAVTCAAGLFGTLCGGYINDFQKRQFIARATAAGLPEPDETAIRLNSAKMCTLQMTVTALIALGCFAVAVNAPNLAIFMVFFFLGEFALFMPTALQVEVLMLFVQPSQRALAIGLYNFLGHALGDVPAPIIVGSVKDEWAPKCNSVKACCTSDSCNPNSCCEYGSNVTDACPSSHAKLRSVLGPDCDDDRAGMRNTLMLVLLWLVACIFCWAWAHWRIRRSANLNAKKNVDRRQILGFEDGTSLSLPFIDGQEES